MQAIVMAGGKGTRLRPLTENTPKPMVPLIDKPVLTYILELLKKHGITDVAMTLGYLPEKVTEYFGDGKKFGVKLTYFYEKEPLGTAGGVKNASSFLTDENFFVISGDAYSEIDLGRAFSFHLAKRSPLTLIAQPHPYPNGLGTLKIDFENRIVDFIEKPKEIEPSLVNTGIYVLNRGVLDLIPDGYCDFGRDILPRSVGRCYACIDYSYWSDIGTLSAYYETNKHIAEKIEKKSLENVERFDKKTE